MARKGKPKRGPNYERNKVKRGRAFQLAKARYLDLLVALGARCEECDETNITLLSVDHVDGITWNRWALRYDARIAKYIKEHKTGVRLRVLCIPCNGRDGRRRQDELEEAPF